MSLKDNLNKKYSSISNSGMHNVLTNREKNYFKLELSKIKNLQNKKILEIGFGNGSFLEWSKLNGLNTYGYEINLDFYDKLKNRHKVYLGNGFDFDEKINEKFDLIIMFDVVEHIIRERLEEFFLKLNHILNKNGIILMRFPNGSSPFGLYYFNSDLTHELFLNKRSMRMLCDLTGFEIEYFDNMKRSNYFESLRGKLFGKINYLIRDIIEIILGNLYFGERVKLDPNVVCIIKKL